MTSQEIEKSLMEGAKCINGYAVDIRDYGTGYVAHIECDRFNTIVETPKTIPSEGLKSFYERVAAKLVALAASGKRQ